jgi:hypothetical protein
MYKIVFGLETDKKNYTTYDDISDIEELSIKDKNSYLVYDGDEEHKIYFDFDLKKDEYEKHGTYEEIKDNLLIKLKQSLEGYSKLSIAEACKKDEKISYRVIMNDFKLKINDMKIWVKDIKENEFDGYLKEAVDTAPYMKAGKIRLPYSIKENRTLNIIQGKFKDFLTNKVNDAELIDIEPIKEKQMNKVIDKVNKIVSKEKMNNNKIDNDIMTDLLNNLDISRANNYLDWVVVGMALYNDGYDQKLFKDFSKRSKKYIIGCDITKWNQFKNIKSIITSASLWYYLSKDNNEKFNQLRDKVDEKNYDFKIDLTQSYFSEKTMYELLKNDVLEMGSIQYKKRFFTKTKSYQYFNYYHFKLINNDMIFLIEYVGNRKDIIKIDIRGYSAFEIKISDEVVSFIPLWMKSIEKQSYSTLDFLPKCNTRDNIFNLFNGFVYENDNKEYELEKIQPFLDHIKYLCSDEEHVFNYVLDWISHIIQKPSRKTESAIVFYSHKEGIGKNIFTQLLEKIFNGYVANDMKLEGLVGKFNSMLKGKLLVIADEVAPTAKELNNELKNIITRHEINIEYKGQEPIKMKDCSNFIFTTNNEMAFRVSEEDRRYCLIECPLIKKDAVYFDNLYKLIEDDSMVKQFFNFLLVRDISKVNIRNIPITEYKKRNMVHNLPSHIKMIIDNPEYFCMNDWSICGLKNESLKYDKEHFVFHKNITDRRIALDMAEKFEQFKKKSHGNIVYRFNDPDSLKDYIKLKFGTGLENYLNEV